MADGTVNYACGPCRASKVGCDKSRPQCMRCLRKNRCCNYSPPRAHQRSHPSNHSAAADRGIRPNVALDNSQPSPARSHSRICKSPTGRNSDVVTMRRRNRIPNSCARCRQLKVKCDRQEPCGRCLRVDKGRTCHYPTATLATTGDSPLKQESVPLYKQTFYSGHHWSALVENIESLLKHRRWPGHYHRHVGQEQLFSCQDNLFGNTGSLHNATRRTLLSYIPPHDIADSLVQLYLDIIEPSHKILHVPSFKEEVARFWDKPSSVDDGWVAQFFTVLALGCRLQDTSGFSTRKKDSGILASRLYDAAQVFLQRTPFMIQPELTSIRTLCLFVIYKQTKGVACIESAALWPATGLIVRLAVIMGLHLTDPIQGARSTEPANARNMLWAAVVLLDLRQSLASGMPVIPPSRDLIAEPLFSIGDALPATREGKDCFSFPLIIYHNLPQIFRLLELATSPQGPLAYCLVTTYDRQIRGLLKHYQKSFSPANDTIDTSGTSRIQWTMINIFFRRVLLALHSRLYQEPQASTRFPVSYWSSLECSLALLSEQRELWDASSAPGSNTAAFFARHFQQEFFLAAITVCFHLVQAYSPLVSPNSHKCQGQARRTILDLLGSCRDIWSIEKGASACHSRAFAMIESLLRILEDAGEEDGFRNVPPTAMALCACPSEAGSIFCLDPWEELGLAAME